MHFFNNLTTGTRRAEPKYWLVYVLAILVNLQAFMVVYSNSTYLETFTTPEVVGLLYTVGSAISIFVFLFISRILRKVGNTLFTVGIAAVLLASLLVMGLSDSAALIITFFVVYLITSPLLYMSLDVFSEALIGNNEGSTGSKRGLTLSLMSLAAASGPLIVALIVGDSEANLTRTYLAASMFGVIFIALTLIYFQSFTDPKYKEIRVMDTLQMFFAHHNLRNAFLTHLALQIFFSWAVIYIPLYLFNEIGLSWEQLGLIFGIGLFAYVLFEWPIGYLADKYFGEKEMMALGFLILIVSTSWIAFLTTASIVAWALLMFINRTGAALVEVTTESYFFKHTDGTDASLISFFRLTRPLGMVIGSLIGSAALLYVSFDFVFIIFAVALIPAMLLTATLQDTK